jgi:glycosyltransferase involved in cell wall biosynthesis
MKILNIIESLTQVGGAEQALLNLLPALRARGLECEVAVLWPPYTLAADLEKHGIKVHRLDIPHRWAVIKGTLKLAELLKKRNFDIIHAHLFFAEFYTALTYPIVPSPRRVVSFHNLAYDIHLTDTIWKKFRKQMHSFLLRYNTNSQIGVSSAVAEHYSFHLNLQNVKVIHNAFPIDDVQQEIKPDQIRAAYDIAPNDFLMIMPGRLSPEKNHNILLEALTILREKNLYPRLLIVGDGPLWDSLNNKIVKEQVILHHGIPHEELQRIIQVADVLVMPSISEGFGLVHAEAMSLSTPVIATSVGGVTDLIEDGISGLLVPSGNAVSLADKIALLMTNSKLQERLGQGGRKRIETCFSVDVIANRYIDFYTNTIRNKKCAE